LKTKNLAIYNPKVAAAEYARWACNLYNGCPHQCEYCYCKRGILGATMGGALPEIKKQLGGTKEKAFEIFCKELKANADQIRREGGLFFSFSTDPMVAAELPLTARCIEQCFMLSVPVVILTKAVLWWYNSRTFHDLLMHYRHLIAIGFTLTGHDELESCAASNDERINLMALLSGAGFKIWASIEPIIDPLASLASIRMVESYCQHFKIELRSGVKKDYYDDVDLNALFLSIDRYAEQNPQTQYFKTFYFKDSFVKRLGLDRSTFQAPFVDRNFSLFDV